jgi:hypothetical protein
MWVRAACLVAWLGACGFAGKTTSGGGADAGSRPDARPGDVLWRIETDADFTAPGHVATRMAITRGVAEPFAYAYGALRVWGSNEQLIAAIPDATTWAMLAGQPAAGRSGFALTTLPGDATRRAGGLAFDSDDEWTMWGEGEIWLDAGTNQLHLAGDDFGLVEIVAPNGNVTRLAINFNNTVSSSFDAPVDGWYPVRVALAQISGPAFFRLEVDPQGNTPRHRVEAWRFRTAVNDLSGTFMVVSDEPFLTSPSASDLYEGPLVSENWAAGTPTDLGVIDPNYYCVRWSGQILITTPGDYALRVRTDDGLRLWIDDQLVYDQWATGGASNMVTPPITLAAGWHDVVYQMMEGIGDARAELSVETGPVGAGEPLPVARLRPVTGMHARLATMKIDLNATFNGSYALYLTAGPGATTTYVGRRLIVDHPNWDGLDVVLDPPNANPITVLSTTNMDPGSGAIIITNGGSVAGAVDGTWNLTFTDGAAADEGVLQSASFAIEYRGGHPAIDLDSMWTSPVHDLGADVAISELTWDAHLPAPSTLVMEVRGCDDPACDGEAWIAVAAPGPLAQPLAAARYAQVQVRMTGNGAVSPWLDWIDLVAR